MSVVLIYDEVDAPLEERILAVVLPSRKVIEKDDSEEGITEYLGEFADRWKDNKSLRESISESGKSFYERHFTNGEFTDLDPNDEEISLGAFYYMILQRFDNQAIGSSIYTDDDAKAILREGGWFNA